MRFLILILLLSPFFESHALSVKSLTSSEVNSFDELNGLFVLFKKDCLPCRKQIADLKCFEGQMKVSLLGGFSSEPVLREELRKMKTSYSGYYADSEVLSRLQILSQATPQLFVLDKGKIKAMAVGYRSCERYKEIFERRGIL